MRNTESEEGDISLLTGHGYTYIYRDREIEKERIDKLKVITAIRTSSLSNIFSHTHSILEVNSSIFSN